MSSVIWNLHYGLSRILWKKKCCHDHENLLLLFFHNSLYVLFFSLSPSFCIFLFSHTDFILNGKKNIQLLYHLYHLRLRNSWSGLFLIPFYNIHINISKYITLSLYLVIYVFITYVYSYVLIHQQSYLWLFYYHAFRLTLRFIKQIIRFCRSEQNMFYYQKARR